MDAIEQLNTVPFEVYFAFTIGFLVLVSIASAALKFVLGARLISRYLLHAGMGAAVGFFILTSPWLVSALKTTKKWPLLDMWPFWGGELSGPFTVSILGSSIGLVIGIFICSRRNRALAAYAPRDSMKTAGRGR